MTRSSRFPGFYRLSLDERRRKLCEATGVALDELVAAVGTGGLDAATADKVVENVVGVYGLPFGVALNVRVNGRDRIVPMVVEEPSVIAAASNAARMVRECGGFQAAMVESLMTTQIELLDVPSAAEAASAIAGAHDELLLLAASAVPGLTARGAGPRELQVRDLGRGRVVVHLHVDCSDAMGANLVNQVAETVAPRLVQLAGARPGLRILTNLSDRRRVRATCRVREDSVALVRGEERVSGAMVAEGIVEASEFAEVDPYRATTHNKGIMNGIDAVVLATGNDFRAVEAGAHAYAARSGSYGPLATWRREGRELVGELELPLALGTVGGTLRVHPAARLALELLGAESAADLAEVAASVGLASNLAALRALATEGIQRGHMALHARAVATAAGATGSEVEEVARALAQGGTVTLERAHEELRRLRRPIPGTGAGSGH